MVKVISTELVLHSYLVIMDNSLSCHECNLFASCSCHWPLDHIVVEIHTLFISCRFYYPLVDTTQEKMDRRRDIYHTCKNDRYISLDFTLNNVYRYHSNSGSINISTTPFMTRPNISITLRPEKYYRLKDD